MNKKKITAAGVIVLALAGIGSGAAMAATPAMPAPVTAVTDTATPGVPEVPDSESAAETPGDGNDGGHADADGVDVNNEGGDAEK